MVYSGSSCAVDIRERGVHRLFRQAVHQIGVNALETGLERSLQSAPRLVASMYAAEPLQGCVVEALYANGKPVHAGFEIAGKAFGLDGAWIRFQRDLCLR